MDQNKTLLDMTEYIVYGVYDTDINNSYAIKFLTYSKDKKNVPITIFATGFQPHLYVQLEPHNINPHILVGKLESILDMKITNYTLEMLINYITYTSEQFLKIICDTFADYKKLKNHIQFNRINFNNKQILFRLYDTFLYPSFYCHIKYKFGNILTFKDNTNIKIDNNVIITDIENLFFDNSTVPFNYGILDTMNNQLYIQNNQTSYQLNCQDNYRALKSLISYINEYNINYLFHDNKYNLKCLNENLQQIGVTDKTWTDILVDNDDERISIFDYVQFKVSNIIKESNICHLPYAMLLQGGIMKKILLLIIEEAQKDYNIILPSYSTTSRIYYSPDDLQTNINTAIINKVTVGFNTDIQIESDIIPFKRGESIIIYNKKNEVFQPVLFTKIYKKYKNCLTLKKGVYRRFQTSDLYVVYRNITFKGGLRIEPTRHLVYNRVIVLDFASLYPSIISKYFPERNPLISNIVTKWIEMRKNLGINGNMYKQFANSLYGQFGCIRSPLYNYDNADFIATQGRNILQRTCDFVKQICGYDVIYGNTDSLFIVMPDCVHSNATCDCVTTITNDLISKINALIDINGIIKIKYERTFQPLYIYKKNRYFGSVDNKAHIVGFKKDTYSQLTKILDLIINREISESDVELKVSQLDTPITN